MVSCAYWAQLLELPVADQFAHAAELLLSIAERSEDLDARETAAGCYLEVDTRAKMFRLRDIEKAAAKVK